MCQVMVCDLFVIYNKIVVIKRNITGRMKALSKFAMDNQKRYHLRKPKTAKHTKRKYNRNIMKFRNMSG